MAIDYQDIIDSLTEDNIKDILDTLSIPYEDKGSYLLCPTACHNEDLDNASKKLYYYKDNKIFVCYTACGSMSVFKFLEHVYEARSIPYDWVEDVLKLITNTSGYKAYDGFEKPQYTSLKDQFAQTRKEITLPAYEEGVLDAFVHFYPPEWLEDGISKAAMDKYGIQYSISQNKIIIPHRDINGRLVGIRGRALNPEEVELVGKYMPIHIEKTWYTHPLGLNLYGLYENKENIKKSGIVYVGEAEKFVLQAESFTDPNCCVAVCGSQFNKFQLRELIKNCHPREIVICFDNEELPHKDSYFNKLWTMCQKYKLYADFSFIYDREGLTQLKQSPTDCGEDIFHKLLSRRIRVK